MIGLGTRQILFFRGKENKWWSRRLRMSCLSQEKYVVYLDTSLRTTGLKDDIGTVGFFCNNAGAFFREFLFRE